jgi:hypothetical protein
MTATVRDIVTAAYRRLGLVTPGEDLDADRALAGLELFNDLIASLQAEGSTAAAPANLGSDTIAEAGVAQDLTPPYALNDAFPMDASLARGIKALLATAIAPEAGMEAPATVQREAERGRKAILAAYIAAPAAQQDAALTWAPSLRRHR